MPKTAEVRGKVVRCLGPGRKGVEHTFFSPDPRHVRVCNRCREIIDRMSATRIDEPMKVVNEGE